MTTVDFLVMQNIMIGLFCECLAMISGNPHDISDVLHYNWESPSLLWIAGFLKAEVVPGVRQPVHELL